MKKNLIFMTSVLAMSLLIGCGKKNEATETSKDAATESVISDTSESVITPPAETPESKKAEVVESDPKEVGDSSTDDANKDPKEVNPSKNGTPEDADANLAVMTGKWELSDCYICSNQMCEYIKHGEGAESTLMINNNWTCDYAFAKENVSLLEEGLTLEYVDFGIYDEVDNNEWTLKVNGLSDNKEGYLVYVDENKILFTIKSYANGTDEPDEWEIYYHRAK